MGQCTHHACNWTVVLHFAMLTVFFLGGGGGGGEKELPMSSFYLKFLS